MTAKKIPEIIKITSRKLRQDMTEVEKILWEKLRNRKIKGKKFLRQFPIYVFTENSGLDRFIIPDFVCKEDKLIIELDGSIHNLKEIYLLDREKEELLIQNGYKIIRFENKEILDNVNNVLGKLILNFSPPFS
ncbi:MAG: endonuclease domain-containing protein [Candidatus Gracilibacteria bacterium]|nr:endonuclease domain-containing protein [Candidatus Gracilibacteria bacterium]MDQ7022900.1 endonuclease domain-containing protein [Candidatus Gracilibacteria bacterium]